MRSIPIYRRRRPQSFARGSLVIGNQDPFLDNNRYLSRLLSDKGIGHALHEWDGRAHRGYYWRRMAPLYV